MKYIDTKWPNMSLKVQKHSLSDQWQGIKAIVNQLLMCNKGDVVVLLLYAFISFLTQDAVQLLLEGLVFM